MNEVRVVYNEDGWRIELDVRDEATGVEWARKIRALISHPDSPSARLLIPADESV